MMQTEKLAELISEEIVAQGNEIDGLGDAESVVLICKCPTINLVQLSEKILGAVAAKIAAAPMKLLMTSSDRPLKNNPADQDRRFHFIDEVEKHPGPFSGPDAELARACAMAVIPFYGNDDAVTHQRIMSNGIWNDHIAVQAALAAVHFFKTKIEAGDGALLEATVEADRLRALISRPYVGAWCDEIVIEAAHQRERWGAGHDCGKAPEDWFWLVGYLAGKCLAAEKAGDLDKARHHTVSAGAALVHWAARLGGHENVMRPGIGPEGLAEASAGAPLVSGEG